MTNFPPLSPMATLRWSIVSAIVDDLQPRSVFEIGCGQGGFGARLAARTRRYVGVEPDAASFATAAARIHSPDSVVLNGTSSLIRAEERFDLVCAFEVIEHLDDDHAALAEWATRVAPDGHLLVSVPAWPHRFGPMDELVGHYRRYAPDQLDRVLRKAGCESVRHRLYGWPLGYGLEFARNSIARRTGRAWEDSREERSAGSGRLLQPNKALGVAIKAGMAPFTLIQKFAPGTGTGLVGVGRVRRR